MTYRELERALKKIAQWRLNYDNAYRQFCASNSTAESRAIWAEKIDNIDYHLDQQIEAVECPPRPFE